MNATTVPAEFGQPYVVTREGERLKVSRRADNGFTHVLVFRRDEFVAVCNAGVDLFESNTQ